MIDATYLKAYLPDVLAVPGFVATQRFRLADETAGKASSWRYMALYEVDSESAETALEELKARAGTDAMILSPTLDRSSVYAQIFTPVRKLPA